MKRGAILAVYVVSILGHAAMGAAVSAIELPPPAPERIEVALRAPTPPPPPEQPPPEPPPPEVAEAPGPAPERAPRQRNAEPPPPEAAAPPPPPAFGVMMSNTGSGPGGIAVPVGDPGGSREAPRTRVREAQRLEASEPVRNDEPAPCPGETRRPRPLSMPHPRYTDAARAAAIEGRVRVEITVGADGSVANARVISPLGYGLDEAALESARSARFDAALDCGRAVSATFVVSIRFTQ